MSIKDIDFTLIESQGALNDFCSKHETVEWLALDTEFIGENRFQTLLCLIQVASPEGLFLIDSLQIEDLQPFMRLMEQEEIVKITHAGENDYRIFYELYGTVPKNIFDTQLAAGFMSSKYPMGFQKLISKELNIQLGKNYAISKWDNRPLSNKQLLYALNDILYLHELYRKQKARLDKYNRLGWAREEFAKWESAEHYREDEHRDFFRSKAVGRMNRQSQGLLLRLYQWRRKEARKRNSPRERVMADRILTEVAQVIPAGKKALHDHRRIPDKIVRKYWDLFNELFQQPLTEEEVAVIESLPRTVKSDKEQDMAADLLFWLIKYRCHQVKIAPSLVLRGSSLKKLKTQPSYQAHELLSGWRHELLGETLTSWLENRYRIKVEQKESGFSIHVETH